MDKGMARLGAGQQQQKVTRREGNGGGWRDGGWNTRRDWRSLGRVVGEVVEEGEGE